MQTLTLKYTDGDKWSTVETDYYFITTVDVRTLLRQAGALDTFDSVSITALGADGTVYATIRKDSV